MPLQDEVLEAFLKQLGESDNFGEEMVDELRAIYASSTRPKPEQIAKVLASPGKQKSSETP